MLLTKGERLIKEWNYGTAKDGKDIKDLSISVTNKRIVHVEQSPLTLVQQEFPVTDVTGVSTSYRTASSVAAIMMIVFGSLFLVAGLIMTILGIIPMIFMIVVGGVMLGIGIYKLVKRPVSVLVSLLNNGADRRTLNTVLFTYGLKKGFGKTQSATNIKIYVNKDVARNMAESIGVAIETAKSMSGMPQGMPPQGQPRPQSMPPQGQPRPQSMPPQGQPRPQNVPPQGQVPPQM